MTSPSTTSFWIVEMRTFSDIEPRVSIDWIVHFTSRDKEIGSALWLVTPLGTYARPYHVNTHFFIVLRTFLSWTNIMPVDKKKYARWLREVFCIFLGAPCEIYIDFHQLSGKTVALLGWFNGQRSLQSLPPWCQMCSWYAQTQIYIYINIYISLFPFVLNHFQVLKIWCVFPCLPFLQHIVVIPSMFFIKQ